jgi:uncharacterized membrane protein YidH (DUF202 family)
MSDPSASSNPSPDSSFAQLNNNELAVVRTNLASERTEKSEIRTDLAKDRNRLAAERTLMAWIRTSLSMISFGFGIDRFFAYLKRSEIGTSVNRLAEERVLGLGLIVLGVVALIGGTLNYWRNLNDLERPQFKYTSTADQSFAITIAIVLVFIGLASYIPLITKDISLMEIITLDSQIVQTMVSFAVFFIMLSIGAALSIQDLLNFWQQPALLGRSFLAIVILPPLVFALIESVIDLPQSYVLALIFLIASPGPALLTRRAGMANARMSYVISLQITLALLSIVLTPLILKFFAVLSVGSEGTIKSWQIAKQVGVVQFLPLGIGVLISQLMKDRATEISKLLNMIANTLFIILALIVLLVSLTVVPSLRIMPLIITVLLTFLGLVIGHLIGIGLDPDIQAGIAIATIARNAGLAIVLASLNGEVEAVPIIVAVLIVGIVAGIPYALWMKQKTISTASNSAQ